MTSFSTNHRLFLAVKVLLPWLGILIATAVLATFSAEGGVILSGTGQTQVSGASYHTVSARATLSFSGDTLSLLLENTSPNNTTDPADALSSFYFDIVRNGVRPTLQYQSAVGQVYQLLANNTDKPYVYTPPAQAGQTGNFNAGLGESNLMATKAGDQTWQFKPMNPAATPNLGFGIGTVGNSGYPGNGFDTVLVGKGNTMINFSIFQGGDIQPNGNLKDAYLVKNSATFTFTGVNGWSEADIRPAASFGFGTAPEGAVVVVPEPSAWVLALLGAGGLLWRSRRWQSD